jgi:hypothetical protein
MTSLIPVLELTPGSYSTRVRQTPEGSIAENPEGWFSYWSESLADAGIYGLTPWTPGSWLVTIDQLQDPDLLRSVITNGTPDIASVDIEELGALSGGYVLSHDAATLLPGCCGDLSNLEEWQRAATTSNESWSMLWIGHPWTFVRSSGDDLRFVEPSERQEADGLDEVLSLSRAGLLDAVGRALDVRNRFAERLLPVVQALKPRISAIDVVQVLIGSGRGESEQRVGGVIDAV